jgi:hypothetical protein
MRPLTVVTGFVLGSCFAITVSLAMAAIVVIVVGIDHPRLKNEFPALIESIAIFACLTAAAGASFYTMLKRHAARFVAQAALLLGIALTALYYWR